MSELKFLSVAAAGPPCATALNPLVLSDSDEEENALPKAAVARSSNPCTGKTRKRQKIGCGHRSSLSDSDDDDDDELMFGNGSVFDKNYRCKTFQKNPLPKTEPEEIIPGRFAKEAKRQTAIPERLTNAKVTPKDAEKNVKQENLSIDLVAAMSDSESSEDPKEAVLPKQLLTGADNKPNIFKAKVAHEVISVVDSDDDEEDIIMFGSGSVFDRKHQPKAVKKIPLPEAKLEEATVERQENRSQNEDVRPEENRSTNQVVIPDMVAPASTEDKRALETKKEMLKQPKEVVPKAEKQELKQEKDRLTKKEVVPKPTPEQVQKKRLLHLNAIAKDIDRALQLLLWDIGFSYKLYAHQFEAVRFVAGLAPQFPCSTKIDPVIFENCSRGAHFRSMALKNAAKEFSFHQKEKNASDESNRNYTLPTKGMLLADEMGLGKTIEALAGAALRNAMLSFDNENSGLPTLVVSPQDGIQNQWYETLVNSGVQPSSIMIWGEPKAQRQRRLDQYLKAKSSAHQHPSKQEGSYVLCTRYSIQSMIRKLFKEIDVALKGRANELRQKEKQIRKYKATTPFQNVSMVLIGLLSNQYSAHQGQAKNKYIRKKEKIQDCVARLVRKNSHKNVVQFTYQTIIVDEAHFCKNVLAYWGLGLTLLGTQTRRTVLLTGTPYNNGPSDMTALMTYIDPNHEAARIDWWENAVASVSNGSMHHLDAADAVSTWRKTYLLRRTKDVLVEKLPPRIKTEFDVGALPSELWIYEAYESKFLSALRQLKKNMEETSPEARFKAKKVFEIMMACMACMRMALVHPILPGGREMTIQFSPSRRHLLKREECPRKCVFCSSDPTKTAEKEAKKKENKDGTNNHHPQQHNNESDDGDDGDDDLRDFAGATRTDMDLDDDKLDDDDYEAKSKKERELEEKKKGHIVPLGPEFCMASGSSCQHFAHTKCLEDHLKSNNVLSCPRCHDLKNRLHGKLPHNVYCREVTTHIDDADPKTGGFTASAKIEKAVNWFQTTVPKNDKAIFLSFFKGSLDLIEGILVSKFGIDCARYDGDVSKELRTKDLERFKTSGTCRVLLATVQSGGTGLNITEANHVCFLDRWFNPCVHDQAESRCHRLGQEKEVNIAYLDINFTIDIVMKRINVLKEGNASVILADGTSLGDRWSLGYRNVSGVIGETMQALLVMREQAIKINGNAPLPPYNESDLEEKLAQSKEKPNAIKEERKHKIKSENDMLIRIRALEVASNRSSALAAQEQKTVDLRLFSDTTNIQAGTDTVIGYKTPMPTPTAPLELTARPNYSNIPQKKQGNFNINRVLPNGRTPNRPSHRTDNEHSRKSSWTAQNSSRVLSEKSHVYLTSNSQMPTSTSSGKRPASMSAATQVTSKKRRFAQGLSAIVSAKNRTKEFMRRMSRGDL